MGDALEDISFGILDGRGYCKPQLDGYERFERALRNEMISVKPLYRGPEWDPSVSGHQRRTIAGN